jgi:hypothetical protein
MHLHCNIITLAESVEDAKSNVEIWIDDNSGRELFDYGGLEEPEKVVLLNEVRKDLEEAKADVDKLLPIIEGDIAKYKISGDRGWQGYYHKRLGRILSEDMTDDMPFFNITNWDWSLPTEVPDDQKGCNWYAVRVDLHF